MRFWISLLIYILISYNGKAQQWSVSSSIGNFNTISCTFGEIHGTTNPHFHEEIDISTDGNINIHNKAKIYSDGNIWAQEVKVRDNNPYPDFVFKDNYNMPTIEETEKYIKTHKHLKEIPTEKEVIKNNGIELGKMNVLLLKKVEELTLYIIDLNNKLKKQQKQINELNKLNKDEEYDNTNINIA